MRYCLTSLVVLMTLAASPAVLSAVIEVGPDFNPDNCTLPDAIRAANADAPRGECTAGSGTDIIRLPGNVEINANNFDPLPVIDTPMHFEPAFGITTVKAGARFEIDSTTATFTDLVITVGGNCNSGDPQDDGPVIWIRDSADVAFQNVTFFDLFWCAIPGGGVLYAEDSTMTITSSRFEENIFWFDITCGADCPHPVGLVSARNSQVIVSETEFTGTDTEYDVVVPVLALEATTLELSDSLFDSGPAGRANIFIDLDDFSEADIQNTTFSSQLPESDYFIRVAPNNQITLNHVTMVNTTLDLEGIADLTNTIFGDTCQRTNPGVIGVNAGNWFTSGNCGTATSGDLFLLSLLDRGGPTRTHGLHWLSDAIDAGSGAHCQPEDQRGVPRTALCDIGAFERNDEADLSVAISSLNGAPFYAGQDLVYQVVLNNSGPGIANNAQVNFNTSNLVIDSVSGACTANPCVVNSVIPGASRTIYVHAHPSTPGATGFSLSADVVNGPGSVYNDPNPGNNSDTENDNQVQAADLSITKSFITSPPFTVGQSIQYRVDVDNLGPNTATGVVLSENPSGLNITAISPCNNPPAGPCNLANLTSGNSVTHTVTAEITSTTFDNAASVSGSVYDPVADNDTDDQGNNGNTENDADVRGSTNIISGPPYLSGDVITFSAGVRNYGPDTATNVLMTAGATGGTIVGVRDGCAVLPCDFGSLPNEQIKDALIDVQINAPGLVVLQVYASADQTDTNQANNTDDASVTAQATSDIGVSLTPLTPPPYYAGQLINYQLNVSNLGFDPATNVEVEITTQNLEIVSAFGDYCLELPCTIPALDIVQTEPIDVVATPITTGPFDFSASGSADQYDFQPANNFDTTGNGGTAQVLVIDVIFRDGLENLFPQDLGSE